MTAFRLFAAARAATGVSETTIAADTLGMAIEALAGTLDDARASQWRDVAQRCSFLVDGVTTRDRSTSLVGVAVVDVMPPFAGG